MAKSLEDTAFYRYHRLLALNEVGGDAAASGLDVVSFHHLMSERASAWPHAMTATATHDTKRGEDARARLLALTELSGEWTSAVGRWKMMNAPHIAMDQGVRMPSIGHEYMLYQALIGAWPFAGVSDEFVKRMQDYAVKAAREGKQETSWLNPRKVYEDGLCAFIAAILDTGKSSEFLASFQSFAAGTSLLGALNSLAQLTLKATMPGVPDFYQGTESWDFSLVDPDNRRAVDFGAREAALTSAPANWPELVTSWQDGQLKMQWTRQLLAMRQRLADTFRLGDYVPLTVSGPHRDHVVAFARCYRRHAAIVIVGRKLAGFTDGGRRWPSPTDFDGAVLAEDFKVRGYAGPELKLADAFANLPVAVLEASIR
jgi:(1->4)-alpha-D-glucan 1-alpha-D-glucosylmutase